MKTKSILLVLFAIAVTFTSCKKNEINVVPSANVTTVEKSFNNFNAIDVSDIFTVYVTFSETEESVAVEANDNLQPYIHVSQQGNSLIVELDNKLNIRRNGATLNVYITMHELVKVVGSGAVEISFQNERVGNDLNVLLEGKSMLSGAVTATRLTTDLEGYSNVNFSGHADVLVFNADGASYMEGYDFEADRLEADMNGASNLHLTVNEELDVKANGASYVYYRGEGTISHQDLNGASQIVKVN